MFQISILNNLFICFLVWNLSQFKFAVYSRSSRESSSVNNLILLFLVGVFHASRQRNVHCRVWPFHRTETILLKLKMLTLHQVLAGLIYLKNNSTSWKIKAAFFFLKQEILARLVEDLGELPGCILHCI